MISSSKLSFIRFLCIWCLSSAIVTAKTLEGKLQFTDGLAFNLTSRIVLNHGEISTYSRADGSFVLYNVPPGIHQLDVFSSVYHFPQLKIQLLEDESADPKCLEYLYPGAKKQIAKYPLVLTAMAKYEYFEPRRGFSIFSLLKNPMFLMMGVSVILMFWMPKMMESLDPEEREQMKKQMELQKDPSKMLGQLFSGMTGTEEIQSKKKK